MRKLGLAALAAWMCGCGGSENAVAGSMETAAEGWQRPPYPEILELAEDPPAAEDLPQPLVASPAAVWHAGDFARYRVKESIAVPGSRPNKDGSLPLLPLSGTVTLRVLSNEQGRWWLEARLERSGFWFAMPPVGPAAKEDPHRWIAHPRSAAVRLLVDGPGLATLYRYLFSIDGNPWVEFRRPSGKALLPNNDFWDLFVRPAAPFVASGSSTDSLRQRSFVLIERGIGPATQPAAPSHTVTIDPSVIVCTLAPRKVIAWDIPNFTADLGEEDLGRIPEFISAGVNWFEPEWWGDDYKQKSASAVEWRALMDHAAAFYGQGSSWETDEFDRLRPNFLGGFGFLDEPMSHFNPAKGDALQQYLTHVRGYVRSRPWDVDYWRRTIYSANYPAGVMTYDAEATPLAGFALEVFGKSQLQPVHALNKRGASIAETQANAVTVDSAFMRGSGRVHGIPWGVCVYQGTWQGSRLPFVQALRAEGARYFFLWSFHDDAPLTDDETKSLAQAIRAAPTGTPAVSTALVLPRGVYLPAGLYLPNQMDDDFGLWKDGQGHPEAESVLQSFAKEVDTLIRSGKRFDVFVTGQPGLSAILQGYPTVKRF